MRRVAGAIAVLSGLALLLPVAPALAAPAGPPVVETVPAGSEYVALGDSYSAGFGLTPFSSTRPFEAPDGALNGCYQADENWPHLVAAELSLALNDQTCSGAVTANIWQTPQSTMTSQTAPYVQIHGLTANTKIVTITIGGNDLLFSQMAEYCLRETNTDGSETWLPPRQYNCVDEYGAGKGYDAYALLDGTVKPALTAAFDHVTQQLADLGASAKVFVVGYPQIAPTAAQHPGGCFSPPWYQDSDENWVYPENSVPYSAPDTDFLADVEAKLVGAIGDAATAHGFYFVDAYTASAGHTLCDAQPYIWGLTFFETDTYHSCPEATSQLVYTYYCLELGALHPNAAGTAFLAGQVVAAMNASKAGEPPVLETAGSIAPGAQVTITGSGFAPNQPGIEVWLHSSPILLGTVTSSASGSFSLAVVIPSSVPAGAHTLTAVVGGVTISSSAVVIELAATGFDALVPLLLGLCLMTLGFLLVAARTHRPAR